MGSYHNGSESVVTHNKKGMYFTLLTIAFLVIFLFFFTTHTYRRLTDKMFVIESRVMSMNSFLQDVERDLERGLYISSFRAVLSLQNYMTTKGRFYDNIHQSFKESIINGTINTTPVSLMIDSRVLFRYSKTVPQPIKTKLCV